jgi:hypothetical protein
MGRAEGRQDGGALAEGQAAAASEALSRAEGFFFVFLKKSRDDPNLFLNSASFKSRWRKL